MPNRSVSSCEDACTCPSLCPCVPADVAANLTNLAIIVLRAPWQGCWREGATRWRSLRPKCAGRLQLESTNLHVRNMDLAEFNNLDGRRLEDVADGFTLWHGAQLAIDTTLVSLFRRDGSPRPRAADHGGAALDDACLVVLAAEVVGRWSVETANFLVSLAKAKALDSTYVLQGGVQKAFIRR